MQFFRATVKSLKSDDALESTLVLRVDGGHYDQVSPVGKMVRQVLMIGVFTEDEFLELEIQRGFEEDKEDDES